MGTVRVMGLDITKNVFQVHGVDAEGAVVLRQRVARARMMKLFGKLPPCLVGLVPRQNSSGGKQRLGSISKAGTAISGRC